MKSNRPTFMAMTIIKRAIVVALPAAGGRLRMDNSSGDKLAESDYDAAPTLGLSALVKFWNAGKVEFHTT